MEQKCQYLSFDHLHIAEVRRSNADPITGALFISHVPGDFFKQCLVLGADDAHFKHAICSYEREQVAHTSAGLNIMAWFNEDEKRPIE